MDNLKASITGIILDLKKLRASLAAAKIKPSLRYGTDSQIEDIRFSAAVGKHQERWLFRIYPQENRLSFSGGVTKTFFGHNLWVFNNEYVQLKAVVGIVADRLSEIAGIGLPASLIAGSFESVAVERVELTNHFLLPKEITLTDAIERINRLFMALFPNRRDRSGDTLDDPGTVAVGKSKSTKVCRTYDPAGKAADQPAHVPFDSWDKLTKACSSHLRIELIMNRREIEQLDLQTVEAWQDSAKIQRYLAKMSQRYGLTVAYQTNADALLPADVRATNPTFVDYARYWFTAGERGVPPNKRAGSNNRFRQYMAERGFNINVPFKHHQLLAHDLHDLLGPENRADLPDDVRRDKALFDQWWNATS